MLRPCRNTAAFELLPDAERRLDMGEVEAVLAGAGFTRVVRAGVMLIMRREVEVSVYRSGKMLIKTRDPVVAQGLAPELMGLVGGFDNEFGKELRVEGLDRLAARQGAGVG